MTTKQVFKLRSFFKKTQGKKKLTYQ